MGGADAPGHAPGSVTTDADTPAVGSARGTAPELAGGDRLGRYVVLQRLASGGMGVVYAAYDPELDRQVALKLVRSNAPSDEAAKLARARFVREAQAMAKVSHPNVVPVYDVALFGDRVFLAMELVVGLNAREWRRTAHPSPRDVLAMYVQAGRGLAAAHAAGFVHRDFKPENLLIGKDGRARVTDFGLVRTGEASDEGRAREAATSESDASTSANDGPTGSVLTGANTLLGTPPYMAPEQFEGELVGPKADQFAFCVALYEALYGERPFAGYTAGELRKAVTAGVLPAAPRRTHGVPRWIRRALLRGLARRPEDRWPTMDALLVALQNDPAAPYRRAAAVVGVVALMASGIVLGRLVEERARGVCSGASARLAGVWDAETAAAVEATTLRLDPLRGSQTVERVRASLDRYAEAWAHMFREACEATRVRKEQPEEHWALRLECLEDRRRDLRALVLALRGSDAPAPDRALEATAYLPSVAACADVPSLMAPTQLPPDPALRSAVVGVRETLSRARSELATGRWLDAKATAGIAVDDARRTGFLPLVAESLELRGSILDTNGETGAAEAVLVEALEHALRVRHERLVAASLVELSWVTGYQSGRADEGLRFAKLARAALARLREADELEALLDSYVGSILMRAGRIREAIAAFERSLGPVERLRGPRSLEAGRLHLNIANAHLFADELEPARRHYEAALAIQGEALGPDHPHIGQVYLNLGELHYSSGDVRASLDAYGRCIAIWTRSLGASYVKLGLAHAGASRALLATGDLDEAEAEARRAVDVFAKQPDGLPVDSRHALEALAQCHIARKRHRDAIPLLERALALSEHEPADREGLGDLQFLLARAHGEGGLDEAKATSFARLAEQSYVRANAAAAASKVHVWLTTREQRNVRP